MSRSASSCNAGLGKIFDQPGSLGSWKRVIEFAVTTIRGLQTRLQVSAGCWTARSFVRGRSRLRIFERIGLARRSSVRANISSDFETLSPGRRRSASKRGPNRRLNYLPATLNPLSTSVIYRRDATKSNFAFLFSVWEREGDWARSERVRVNESIPRNCNSGKKFQSTRRDRFSVDPPLDSLPFVRTSSTVNFILQRTISRLCAVNRKRDLTLARVDLIHYLNWY